MASFFLQLIPKEELWQKEPGALIATNPHTMTKVVSVYVVLAGRSVGPGKKGYRRLVKAGAINAPTAKV